MKSQFRPAQFLLLVVALGLSACSTTSMILTNPPGAKIYLSGRYLGLSPVEAELTDGFVDGANYWVKIKKEGYKTQDFKLRQRWSPGYIVLDILICLPTLGAGCYLVYLNGKTHDSEYVIPLEPTDPSRATPPPPVRAPSKPPEEVSFNSRSRHPEVKSLYLLVTTISSGFCSPREVGV